METLKVDVIPSHDVTGESILHKNEESVLSNIDNINNELSSENAEDALMESPDFSQLREVMTPEPEKKFIPPENLNVVNEESEEEDI